MLKSAARRRVSQLLSVGVAFALAVGLVLVWTRVVRTLTTASPPQQQHSEQPQALVWNGRVFTTAAQLKTYLEAKGLSYGRWAARHPTAFGRTAHTTANKPAPKRTPKPKPRAVAAPPVVATESRSFSSRLLTILLLVGGFSLAASALIPERLAPYAMQRLYAEPDRRIIALAGSLAMLIGVGASYLVG